MNIHDTPEQFQRAIDLVKDPHGIRQLVIAHDELLAAARRALAYFEALPYEPSIHPSTKAQDALHDAITRATGATP